MQKQFNIPKEIRAAVTILKGVGFEAYLVGGCVRDLLLGTEPKDWDITTNATPEKIQELFPNSFYENKFGTVSVVTGSDDPRVRAIEITPFRIEGKYSDKRHPDEIKFANKLEEDPLRIMRAVRLASELNFQIEDTTQKALEKKSNLLKFIAHERIRDEFSKMIMSEKPSNGLNTLREFKILDIFLPELVEGRDVGQNKHHIYTVWEHNLNALDHAAKERWPLVVRVSALFHDVGKPRSKHGDGPDSTFYNHDVIGDKMSS